jgi:hypothetical protein
MSAETFRVGDRVRSTYGAEHDGTVTFVSTLWDGRPTYHVERDTDGFLWLGWVDTMTALGSDAA